MLTNFHSRTSFLNGRQRKKQEETWNIEQKSNKNSTATMHWAQHTRERKKKKKNAKRESYWKECEVFDAERGQMSMFFHWKKYIYIRIVQGIIFGLHSHSRILNCWMKTNALFYHCSPSTVWRDTKKKVENKKIVRWRYALFIQDHMTLKMSYITMWIMWKGKQEIFSNSQTTWHWIRL